MKPALAHALLVLVPAALAPTALAAQVDSARFVVRRGADTVAVEHYARDGVRLRGVLDVRGPAPQTITWSGVVAEDHTVPLVEATVRRPVQGVLLPDGRTPKVVEQRARVIFKADSVSVDEITNTRLDTRILPTTAGAVPYLNLSFALVEQALRRAAATNGALALFNLGGGQTARGSVTRTGDAVTLALGAVTMAFTLDRAGHIVRGEIPSQRVTIERVAP